MLNTLDQTLRTETRWEHIQQPIHGSAHAADYLRLLAALDEGWQIAEAADMLAHGANAEGRGYLLTLTHSRRLLTRQWSVMGSPDIDLLLTNEHVPMAGCQASC